MADIFIPVLLGSGREGRQSEAAARYVFAQLQAAGVDTELVDVRDVATPFTHGSWQPSERTSRWRETMARADGLVIVSPEYNHGYPGELKIALDALLAEYDRKPVALCGVSSGIFGGARVIEQLRQVVIYLGMVPIRGALSFPNVKTLFDADGKITDPAFGERVAPVFEELFWYARILKPARAAMAK
jgi:NAD(P)H-dependent FMN reductase